MVVIKMKEVKEKKMDNSATAIFYINQSESDYHHMNNKK